MSYRPPNTCHAPGCPRLTYSLYCREHELVAPAAATLRNGDKWQRFRRWFLARHPYCADPFGVHGQAPQASRHVHHVELLANRLDLAYDPSNCRALCHGCHGKISGMERRGLNVGNLFDTKPLASASDHPVPPSGRTCGRRS